MTQFASARDPYERYPSFVDRRLVTQRPSRGMASRIDPTRGPVLGVESAPGNETEIPQGAWHEDASHCRARSTVAKNAVGRVPSKGGLLMAS